MTDRFKEALDDVCYGLSEMPNGYFVGECYMLTHDNIKALGNYNTNGDSCDANRQFISAETKIREYVWKACKRALAQEAEQLRRENEELQTRFDKAHELAENYLRGTHELQAKMDKAKWQPIETAPKDGETKALYGCYKNGKRYTQITARGSGVGGLHVNVPTGFRSYTGATHWMPLPDAPEQP